MDTKDQWPTSHVKTCEGEHEDSVIQKGNKGSKEERKKTVRKSKEEEKNNARGRQKGK